MDLEQRVTILEQEVEILKNQIQATLLDIQEQLLTNAYPSLRAEEDSRQAAKQVAQNRPAATPLPVREQPQPRDEMPDAPNETPIVRKVSLDSERAQAEESVVPVRPAKFTASARQQSYPADEETDETAEEPRQTPAVHQASPRGKQPVARQQSYVADEEADEDTDRSRQTPVARKAAANGGQPQPVAHRQSKTQNTSMAETDLAEWVQNKVEQVGVNRTWELIQLYAQKGRITPEVRDMLLGALSAYGQYDPDTSPETFQDYSMQQDQSARSGSAASSSPVSEDGEPGEVTQRLVLKLIAGVQNAGAGIGRRKKHG
jgi:archaellum component FlaD/FlaE